MSALTTLVAGVTSATLLASSAWGLTDREEALAALPESAWPESIVPLEPNITELEPNVTELDTRTTEGEETVIALASDILFEFDQADLPASAESRIEQIVADVPEDALLRVHGHTDSLADDAYNQELSERRAEAVAEVVQAVRPDLELDVAGFGETEPVAPNERNGEDDPEGRALNRRVELRYDG